jgi:hypothetical protein
MLIMRVIPPNHHKRQDARRDIIGDDRHKRAVGRRLQAPRCRHGSSRLRIFGKDLDRLAFALVRRWSVESSFNQVSVSKGRKRQASSSADRPRSIHPLSARQRRESGQSQTSCGGNETTAL